MNAEGKVAKVSVEEYLKYDARIDGKAEYYDGVVREKVSVPPDHCLITVNAMAAVHHQLREKRYRVFAGGLRYFVPEKGAFIYPDFSVVEGDLQYATMDRNTLQNPLVVVEVVSPESAVLDRIHKFNCYWTMPSLREYVLIEQDTWQVEVLLRLGPDRWMGTRYTRPDDQVRLESLGIQVAIQEIYSGTTLESPSA